MNETASKNEYPMFMVHLEIITDEVDVNTLTSYFGLPDHPMSWSKGDPRSKPELPPHAHTRYVISIEGEEDDLPLDKCLDMLLSDRRVNRILDTHQSAPFFVELTLHAAVVVGQPSTTIRFYPETLAPISRRIADMGIPFEFCVYVSFELLEVE